MPMTEPIVHSPGPWQQCGASNSQCRCGRIWSRPADVPIAEVLYHRPDDFEESPSFEIACGNALLIAQAPNAPHVCSDPKCPGDVNRRKLELWDEMREILRRHYNTLKVNDPSRIAEILDMTQEFCLAKELTQ